MGEQAVVGIATIVVLGVAGQWLAWRFRLPAILLLLLFGFLAGPLAGILEPDELFGGLLTPFIALSVGVILFEGGLNLRLSEFPAIRTVVFSLITVGAAVTWMVVALAAAFFLQLPSDLSVLLGAVLVVSGPTVIVPLLRHVRPAGALGSILRWEAILIDPLGAMLAVLVFEAILATGTSGAVGAALVSFFKTVLAGGAAGILGARLFTEALRRYWIPDFLHNASALLMVVVVFAVSNVLQRESGLLATTVMGIAMANQRRVDIRHVLHFKETLRVLLIAAIFVVLAARLRVGDFLVVNPWRGGAFLATVILVARPLAVLLSTIRSRLGWRERALLAGVAPRGIVAAAIVSVFAMRLEELGVVRAQELVPLTFLVIIGTVVVYGLSSAPLARWLRVAIPQPQGVLIVGADRVGRLLAEALRQQAFDVQLVDTSWANVAAARLAGLTAHYGSALSEEMVESLALEGIGRLLAVTSNDEVNALATHHFQKFFGRAEVYQLATKGTGVAGHLCGRVLFAADATLASLLRRLDAGAVVKTVRLTKEFDMQGFAAMHGPTALPLFAVDAKGSLAFATAEAPASFAAGQTLTALVDPRFAASRAEEERKG